MLLVILGEACFRESVPLISGPLGSKWVAEGLLRRPSAAPTQTVVAQAPLESVDIAVRCPNHPSVLDICVADAGVARVFPELDWASHGP